MERPGKREFYYDFFHGSTEGRNVFPALVSEELQKLLLTQGKPGVLGSSSLCGETVSLVPGEHGAGYVRDRMAVIVIPAIHPELILFIVSRSESLQVAPKDNSGADALCKGVDSILPSMVALQQVYWNVADMVEVKEGEEHNFTGGSAEPLVGSENLATMLNNQVMKMPELSGLSLRKGLRLLQGAEVEVTVRGTGRIFSQSPEAGKPLSKGDQCVLTLKTDDTPDKVMQINTLQTEKATPK